MKRTLVFIWIILLIASMAAAFAADSPAPASVNAPDADQRVTLELKDVPFANVIEALFAPRHINHVVEPMPNPPTVTMVLKEVSFEDALQAVLKAAGATCRVEAGVYYISPLRSTADEAMEADLLKQLVDLNARLASLRATLTESHPDVRSTKAAIADVEGKLCQLWNRTSPSQSAQPTSSEKPVSEAIQLRYLRPAEIGPQIQSVAGVRTVTAVGTNKLLVTGTKSAIADVQNLVAQLDDESAIPKPVRVKVELRAPSLSADGKLLPCSVTSECVSIMGSQLCGDLDLTPYGGDKRGPLVKLSSKLTPCMSADGKINLKWSGSVRCMVSDQVMTQDYDITTLTESGKPVVVHTGSFDVGGKTADFELQATVTIGSGIAPTAPKKPSSKSH
jgi:hypothetical protein